MDPYNIYIYMNKIKLNKYTDYFRQNLFNDQRVYIANQINKSIKIQFMETLTDILNNNYLKSPFKIFEVN